MNLLRSISVSALTLVMTVITSPAQQKRLIGPDDCSTVQYIVLNNFHSPIQMNPQGTRLAYLVRVPNLKMNRDDDDLYVRDIAGGSDSVSEGKPFRTGTSMPQMKWLEDGQHLVLLSKTEGHHASVVELDVASGKQEVLASNDKDIVEYTTDAKGTTIVYATEDIPALETSDGSATQEETARGFRIPYELPDASGRATRRLYITRKATGGEWSAPELVMLESPITHKSVDAFLYVIDLHLSMSPNGKSLLVTYIEPQAPEDWQHGLLTPSAASHGVNIVVLKDLTAGSTSLPFRSPTIWDMPLWSTDSRSFMVVAQSPVNSEWEREDIRDRVGRAKHLFWVEPDAGRVERIAPHVADVSEQPLLWRSDQELLVHTAFNKITRFVRHNGRWEERTSFDIPLLQDDRFPTLATNGSVVVGTYENPITPPELFSFDITGSRANILEKLNPQFDSLALARTEEVHWKTSTGYEIDGTLFLPPGYTEGHKYPLVISENRSYGFVCSSSVGAEPSQAAEPIASAGMLYLARTYPEDYNEQDEIAHYPKGLPGELGEAAFDADIWDSAVEALDRRGIVDRNKIGIIGFSRKGWNVEYNLVHAKTHYRAATASDNVKYSLSEYWSFRSASGFVGYDFMYGGPPYGVSLKNWMDYSVSFNLDKIETPLLLETMGYDIPEYKNLGVTSTFELLAGLHRLKKPVEYYFYPHEVHLPEHPQARLSSVQRNVDWYRFWLQGFERAHPEDPEQYVRWRKLRDLQEAKDGQMHRQFVEGVGVP
jgi:dipeptidyl aminopeptidase/acylaminoacyl peptidase